MSDSSRIGTAQREFQPRPNPGGTAPRRDPLVRRVRPYRAAGPNSAERCSWIWEWNPGGYELELAPGFDFFRPYESDRFPELGTDKLSAGHTQRGWTGSPVSGAPVFAVRRQAADGTPFTVTFEIPGLNWAVFRPHGMLGESDPSPVSPAVPEPNRGAALSPDARRVVTDVFAERIAEHDFAADGALPISLGRELDLVVEDGPSGHLEYAGESLETPVRVSETGEVAFDVARLQRELEARGGALPVQLAVLASAESVGAGDEDAEPSDPPPMRRGRGDDDAAAAAREALRNVREGEQLESEVAAAVGQGVGDPRAGGQRGSADAVDLSRVIPSELNETLSDESEAILRESEPLRSLLRQGSVDVRDLEIERLERRNIP
ncbi:MAG: hypothetical protein AAFP04_15525 [Myxococcota bacterium]